jgi:serine/threonine protein kinase
MGVVYRAEDEKLRRTVALKVLLPATDPDGDGGEQARFLREARAAAAIKHPNVATIYEVGEAEGCAYLAMEHIEGKTLRQLLGERPPQAATPAPSSGLPIAVAVRVATQIARGLRKAHERGIVHRDLKPENVMLDEEQQVKVLDFGIAKHTATEQAPEPGVSVLAETVARPTGPGRVLGTPGYMAPEQARGASVDPRADIFSLGVILYEALAGVPPFRGDAGLDVLIATTRDTPTPLSTLGPSSTRSPSR